MLLEIVAEIRERLILSLKQAGSATVVLFQQIFANVICLSLGCCFSSKIMAFTVIIKVNQSRPPATIFPFRYGSFSLSWHPLLLLLARCHNRAQNSCQRVSSTVN